MEKNILITTLIITLLLIPATIATGYYCEPINKKAYFYCDDGWIRYNNYKVIHKEQISELTQSKNPAKKTIGEQWKKLLPKQLTP
jgi:hypothetical protein